MSLTSLSSHGRGALLSVAVVASACAQAHARRPATPETYVADTYVARLETLALIQTLSAQILASPSATLTLEAWCRDHAIADPAVITAVRLRDTERHASAEQRRRFGVTPQEPVKYRRVQLRCGDEVLSEADNWYVPSRLTTEMNRLLDTTETPFGRVVQPLEPYRRTVAVKMLWSPLPDGWERRPHARTGDADADGRLLKIPDALFELHAMLYTRDHVPFSEVREVYQRGVLAFRAPTAPASVRRPRRAGARRGGARRASWRRCGCACRSLR